MIKILVIGANGQVGSELKAALDGLEKPGIYSSRVVFSDRTVLDLADVNTISRFLKVVAPDIIVNASAYTAVDKAESETNLAFLINEAAVAEMALYCKLNKSSLIHISTDYVFDGKSEKPYSEADRIGPCSVYGSSKLAGERAIQEVLDEHIILRTSWVFGASGTNFVKTMLRLAERNVELGVVADQFGAPTSARAIAETVAGIIDRFASEPESDRFWGTYHYSGSPYVSWAEFAAEIFEQATLRELIPAAPSVKEMGSIDYPTPVVRHANSRLDCSKIKSTFGIEPDDWKRSLGLMLDELKKGMWK